MCSFVPDEGAVALNFGAIIVGVVDCDSGKRRLCWIDVTRSIYRYRIAYLLLHGMHKLGFLPIIPLKWILRSLETAGATNPVPYFSRFAPLQWTVACYCG